MSMNYNTPTAEELAYLSSIRDKKSYGFNDRVVMYNTFNRLFNANKRPTSCGACVAEVHKALMMVLNTENNKPKPLPKRGRPKKQDNGTDNTQ